MPTLVVGGAARNTGKTSLICSLIAAFPECPWTAIKITSHDHGAPTPIWDETESGQGTDTARYRAAGAHRALLVTAREGQVPIDLLRAALADDPWLIYETNQIQSLPNLPDIILALTGSDDTQAKPSFAAVLRRADAIISINSSPAPALVPTDEDVHVFVLPNLTQISPEFIQWLRVRLGLPAAP
jgi:hypothetical protein